VEGKLCYSSQMLKATFALRTRVLEEGYVTLWAPPLSISTQNSRILCEEISA
jgi:hypothetical protein